MAIIKCQFGHYYDNVKYKECPHCNTDNVNESEYNEVTIAKIAGDRMKKNLASFVAGKDERTIGIYSLKGQFKPVVGWFICTEGNEKGRDYRISSGRNFIGRSYQMDISISDDKEISRDNHCSVVFDPKSILFSIVPGESIVYHNGNELLKPMELKPYDKIILGKTTLQFVPYCKEGVMWE